MAQHAIQMPPISITRSAEIDKPLYLCGYKGFSSASVSLDGNEKCSGEGTLLQANPVGYTSKAIRIGFLFAVRCRNSKAGMYISLNAHCESPEDQYQDSLGALRAIEN